MGLLIVVVEFFRNMSIEVLNNAGFKFAESSAENENVAMTELHAVVLHEEKQFAGGLSRANSADLKTLWSGQLKIGSAIPLDVMKQSFLAGLKTELELDLGRLSWLCHWLPGPRRESVAQSALCNPS